MRGDIRLRLAEVARRKGVENPFALSKVSGLNYAVCYKLWHEHVGQITFPTLARLCETLDCGPGELLAYIEGKTRSERS